MLLLLKNLKQSIYGKKKKGKKKKRVFMTHTWRLGAPKGTGGFKLGGNYAPTFPHIMKAKKAGYALTLHLDSKTNTYIDEFSTSNFVALTAPGKVV
jgi:branched-subunit amino acid aminotransferase/4-amino-4-deoxychorismate lyase